MSLLPTPQTDSQLPEHESETETPSTAAAATLLPQDDHRSNVDPSSVQSIGIACRTCHSSISWDVAYCPKCGETFPFQPKLKTFPNSSVPTAKQAAADYQANLAAAFRAAGHATSKDSNPAPQGKRTKQENKYAGTIVKPHTFSSYGISTSVSQRKTDNYLSEAAIAATEKLHRGETHQDAREPMPKQFARRKRKQSSYDQSRARLLEKDPSLLQRASVLHPGAASAAASPDFSQPINHNQHLTDVLVTLCKIEKAEGNLLPAASFERAALSLSRYKQKILNANDLSAVRGVDACAQSKIEEILHAALRRQLGGGKDIMMHASDLIDTMKAAHKKIKDTPQVCLNSHL